MLELEVLHFGRKTLKCFLISLKTKGSLVLSNYTNGFLNTTNYFFLLFSRYSLLCDISQYAFEKRTFIHFRKDYHCSSELRPYKALHEDHGIQNDQNRLKWDGNRKQHYLQTSDTNLLTAWDGSCCSVGEINSTAVWTGRPWMLIWLNFRTLFSQLKGFIFYNFMVLLSLF